MKLPKCGRVETLNLLYLIKVMSLRQIWNTRIWIGILNMVSPFRHLDTIGGEKKVNAFA